MAKAKLYESNGWKQVWIFCPGCQTNHGFTVKVPTTEKFKPWSFNGNYENPTFSPSMLVNASDPKSRCHSFVTDGKIQFLSDCFHDLKNQTVELPEIE